MTRNPGHLPADCQVLDEHGQLIGTRSVHVRLFNGHDFIRAAATNWRISTPPRPFEIEQYEVI